jgi:hypothetical protein
MDEPAYDEWLTRVSIAANELTALALEWRIDDSDLADKDARTLLRRDERLEYRIPAAAAVMEAALILRQMVVLGSEEITRLHAEGGDSGSVALH